MPTVTGSIGSGAGSGSLPRTTSTVNVSVALSPSAVATTVTMVSPLTNGINVNVPATSSVLTIPEGLELTAYVIAFACVKCIARSIGCAPSSLYSV